VFLNFQGSRGLDIVKIWDADKVTIDTDAGGNSIYVNGADDVDITLDQYANSNNWVRVYHADDVDVHITGGSNLVYAAYSDDVEIKIGWGDNIVDVWDVDDVIANIGGTGDNYFKVYDADAVDATIAGPGNVVNVEDADDVDIDMDNSAGSGGHTIDVTDADDVSITTSEGGNTIRLIDVDSVDIATVGWHNDITVKYAGDAFTDGNVHVHNTWGSSRYQKIHIDDADDVTIDMHALNDSWIWIGSADDIIIGAHGSSTGSNNIINIGMDGQSSVEDVTVHLGGSNNTVNVNSSVDLFSQADIDLDMGTGGSTDVSAYGGTVDIKIKGSSRDDVTAAGLYASVYTYGGDDDIDVVAAGADVDAGEGDDHVTVASAGASVKLGAGDDEAWISAVGVHVDAGSGDDMINLAAAGANVLAGSGNDDIHVLAAGANVKAGSGHDDVWVGAAGAHIDTAGGDDWVWLTAGGAYVNTGAGDDHVSAIAAGSYVYTGAGDDDVVLVGLASAVNTGDGNDSIYSAALGQFIYAGGGDNDIVALGGANAIWAEGGDDTIVAVGGANVIVSEDGDDLVIAGGVGNFLFTGDGQDDVLAVGHGNVTVTADGDDNVFVVGGIGSAVAGHMAPVEALGTYVTGSSLTQLLGANVTMSGTGDDFVTAINVGSSGGLILNPAQNWEAVKAAVWTGNAFSLLKLLTGWQKGKTDTTAPSINLTFADDGDDTVVSIGERNIVVGGLGRDTIVSVGKGNYIFGGDAFASIDSQGYKAIWDPLMAEQERLSGESDGDTIITAGSYSRVYAMDGDDSVISVGWKNVLDGGRGDDLVVAAGVKNILNSGGGDDILVGVGAGNFIMGGTGDDILISAGLGSVVSTDHEGSLLGTVIDFAAMLVVDGVEGLYGVISGAGSEANNLDRLIDTSDGAGDDIAIATGAASLIFTGHGDDVIYAGGLGSFVYAGSGDDLLVSTAGGSALLGGAGDDTIVDFGGAAIIDGGDGHDTFVGIGYGMFQDYADVFFESLDTFQFALTEFLSQFGDAVGGTMSELGDEIGDMFASIGEKLGETEDGDLAAAGDAVKEGMGDAAGYITDGFQDLMTEIVGITFDDLLPGLNELNADVKGYDWSEYNALYNRAALLPSIAGGDGDDTFVTGLGNDVISGGEGSDTYVFYQNEGVDVIFDTGEVGTDSVLFNINQFGSSLLDLGDIHFSINRNLLSDGGKLAISTGLENSTSNILIDDMFDGEDWAIEELTIDAGATAVRLDLTKIYDKLDASADPTLTLAELLGADDDDSFDALYQALEDAVAASDGTREGLADLATVEVDLIIGAEHDKSDDVYTVT